MKKFLSAVLSLSIMLGTCVGVVSAASLESGTASEVFGETEFYVKHDKNRVYWGGGFTATGKLSDDLYQLMIGFYDNGRLVAADRIEIDEALSSYVFKEQCIRLASEPENLTARAFAWSNNGVIPLCGAVDAKNAQFDSSYDETVTPSEFSFEVLENKIELIGCGGKTYVEGNAVVNASGNAQYDMVLNVKNGSDIVWSENITLASKLAEFTINEELLVAPSESLCMTVDFVYNDENLVPTEEKDIRAYTEVVGRVVDVDRLKNTAMYQIERAENFEGKKITGNNDAVTIEVDVANTDIVENLLILTEARLELTESGYRLVSYKLWPENEIFILPSELYRDGSYNGEVMGFYQPETPSKTDEYELDENAVVYVNGSKIRAGEEAAAIEKYVEGSATTEVKLVNTPAPGSKTVDFKIDFIMLSVYASAVIDYIAVDEEEATIYIDYYNWELINSSRIDFDLNSTYNIVDTKGNKVLPDELEKGDIITIYADFEDEYILDNPTSIDFVVSKNIVIGVVEYVGNGKYKVNDKIYGFANGYNELAEGESHALYIDRFGKIVKAIEYTEPDGKYGIINKVWTDTDGKKLITLINSDAEVVTYEFAELDEYEDWKDEFDYYAEEEFLHAYKTVIVTYELDENDKIYSIKSVRSNFQYTTDEFSEQYTTIGLAEMSDKTKILDISLAEAWANSDLTGKVTASSLASFEDGKMYTVVYGGEKFIDGTYSFVIVIDRDIEIEENIPLTVVKSVGKKINEADGIEYDSITVLEGEEEKVLYCTQDFGLLTGDVIVYELSEDGLVNAVYTLFSADDGAGMEDILAQNSKYAAKGTDYRSALYIDYENIDAPSSWEDLSIASKRIRLGYGVLAEKATGYLTIGKLVKDGSEYSTTYVEEIDLAADVNVYIYDQNKMKFEKLDTGAVASLTPTRIGRNFYESGEYYNWTEGGADYVNTVFFKTVDDEITDIIMIIPYED